MPLTGDRKREYQLAWINERRLSWIAGQGGKCAKCGSTKSLEVDHIDPATKLCNPRSIWSRSIEFRTSELAKCQVLCEECHKVKSDVELTIDHPHGTYARYKKRCRCDACKAAVAQWWREYRAAK